MDSEVTLRIKKVDGQPIVTGIIGVKQTADLLQKSRNTVKGYAREGKIRYFLVNYEEPGEAMMFYRVDVISYQKKQIKKQQAKLNKLQKGNSK